MKKLLKIGVFLFVAHSVFADDFYWYATTPDKNFLRVQNWSPNVNPNNSAAPAGVLNEFIVHHAPYGTAIINSNVNVVNGTINAGAGGSISIGMINILSGNVNCNRIQAGMRYYKGIVNIYGGAINLVGIPSRIETTGTLRAFYNGVINFYAGTVEMDYALSLSEGGTLNFFNAGNHQKAPNAISDAPIFAKKGDDMYGLRVGNGTLNVYLGNDLDLAINDVIYLIEYNKGSNSPTFQNVGNGSVMTIDGFRFRLEMARVVEGADNRRAVALVALEPVNTKLQRGSVIMISKL